MKWVELYISRDDYRTLDRRIQNDYFVLRFIPYRTTKYVEIEMQTRVVTALFWWFSQQVMVTVLCGCVGLDLQSVSSYDARRGGKILFKDPVKSISNRTK